MFFLYPDMLYLCLQLNHVKELLLLFQYQNLVLQDILLHEAGV